MRTAGAGDGGQDGADEERDDEGGCADEECPLEGATCMVVSVAGVVDRANRLHSWV